MAQSLSLSIVALEVLAGVVLSGSPPSRYPQSSAVNPSSRADVPWFQECEELVKAGQYDGANRLFMAHLPRGPAAASLYSRMGGLYFEHQQWARARSFLKRSSLLNPREASTHLLLGIIDRETGKQARAKQELTEAAQLAPQNAVNLYFAGQQYLLMGQPAAALPFLYQSVKINPANFDALRALGMAQARLGNFALAETYYREAFHLPHLSPNFQSVASLDLAFLLLLGHNPQKLEEGLAYARRAVQFEPSSAAAHYLEGKALMKLERIREAIPELKEAERLAPQDIKAHFLLARAYARLAQRQNASRELQLVSRIQSRQSRSGRSGMATGTMLPPDSP
jgi:Flp pilus assembly protein TadD